VHIVPIKWISSLPLLCMYVMYCALHIGFLDDDMIGCFIMYVCDRVLDVFMFID
jgi:hypothetical protein